MAHQNQSIDPTLTMDELRSKLQAHLKKSGALTSLKTQLRAMVLTEVTGQKLNEANQQMVHRGGGGLMQANGNCGGVGRNAYAARLADELVEAHLRGTFRSFSHSIFSSEANLQDLNSSAGGGGAYGRDADLALALDIPFCHHDPQQYTGSHSLLTALMERCLKRRSQRSLVSNNNGGTITAGAISLYDFQDSSCQTSESELLRNGPFPSYHTLEQKLSLVDAEHALRRSHVEYATSASLESRMKQHKEELEIVMQKELERKYQQFRSKELAVVRAEEYEKYQHMLRFKEEEKREFERSVEYRMQLERERMEQLKIDLSMQREAMEKRGHDVLALSREREQSATYLERALEEKKGAMQKLQAQLSRLEDICAQRFDEVETYKTREGRRLAEMQRQQRDHLAELKMRDDEIAECRYRLKVVTEEYKHNIDRLTVDYARGGPRVIAAGEDATHNVAEKLFAKYDDIRATGTTAPKTTSTRRENNSARDGAASVAPQPQGGRRYSAREETASIPISSVSSKYLPTTNTATATATTPAVATSVPTPVPTKATTQSNTITPVKSSAAGSATIGTAPQPRTASPTQNISSSNTNPRTSSPLPHRERKPSPTASLSSATSNGNNRSRSPVVSSPVQNTSSSRMQQKPITSATDAPEDSLSASPIGLDGRAGGGGGRDGGFSRSLPSRSMSSSNASHTNNIRVDNNNSPVLSSPAPTRSSTASTPSSSSRKPVLDRTRCTATNPSTNKPCKNPISDNNTGLCVQHKTLEVIASKLESLQIIDEVDARITIFKTEQRDRLQAISSFVLNVLLSVQPNAQNGGRRGILIEVEDVTWKQFMWQHTKDMDALRIARAAARGGAASGGGTAASGSYGGGALALTRDSDDSSDDVGLFKNGSDDESDF